VTSSFVESAHTKESKCFPPDGVRRVKKAGRTYLWASDLMKELVARTRVTYRKFSKIASSLYDYDILSRKHASAGWLEKQG